MKVAGKTGTAELEDTRDPETGRDRAARPVEHRRLVHRLRARPGGRSIAVAVMLVRAGAGGATAAPAARVVLDAAL